jgi:hypothetical protein
VRNISLHNRQIPTKVVKRRRAEVWTILTYFLSRDANIYSIWIIWMHMLYRLDPNWQKKNENVIRYSVEYNSQITLKIVKIWSKLYFFTCCVSFFGEYTRPFRYHPGNHLSTHISPRLPLGVIWKRSCINLYIQLYIQLVVKYMYHSILQFINDLF